MKKPRKSSFESRFWAKVLKTDGCWLWTANRAQSGRGYGQISRDGKLLHAHRVSWEIANGRLIPPGMLVMHSCDNPPCVNPAHLSLGNESLNAIDMVKKGLHYNVKLTEDQVREIRSSSESSSVIAARLGVSAGHIRKVRLGTTRAYV